MRSPWRREPKPIEPPQRVNLKRTELETVKQILSEIFQVRPGEVEEMIQRRLEERIWAEDGLWPATFCLGE